MIFSKSTLKKTLFFSFIFLFLFTQKNQAQDVIITPNFLDFGEVENGSTKELILRFEQKNPVAGQYFAIDYSDLTNELYFEIIGSNGAIFVPPEGIDVKVFFDPREEASGRITGILTPKGAFGETVTTSPTLITFTGVANEVMEPKLETESVIEIGKKDVYSSTTQNITISNSGNADLIISDVELSFLNTEDANDFSLGSVSFPITVSPSSNVDIPILFSPQARISETGSLERSAKVKIISNDSFTDAIGKNKVTINAGVLAPNLEIPSSEINFSNVLLESTENKEFIIKNSGSGTVVITDISLVENPSSTGISIVNDYKITNTFSFPYNLSGNSELKLNISFTPSVRNQLNWIILKTTTLNDDAQTNRNIKGTGVVSSLQTPTALSFGNVRLGNTSENISLEILNNGDVPITISKAEIFGENASDFAAITNTATTINAGEKIIRNLTFTPSDLGDKSAIISFESDAVNSPHSINISGKGINSNLQVDTSEIIFEAQEINTSSTAKKIVLSNKNGTDAVIINTIKINGDDASHFILSDIPTTIDAGAEKTINLQFNPTSVGEKSAILNIDTNDDNSPQNIAISGTVLAPKIESSKSVSFKNTDVNGVRKSSFVIRNKGDINLTIEDISLSENEDHFTIETITYPLILNKGEEKTVKINFNPKTDGSFNAPINITTKNIGVHQIALGGKGIAPKLIFSSNVNLGDIDIHSNQEIAVFIKNEGSKELKITNLSFTGSNASLFGLASTTYPITIKPDEKQEVIINLQPENTGEISASLTAESNSFGALNPLNFNAKAIASPEISVISHLILEDVDTGTSSDTKLTLTNIGSADLIIYDVFTIGASLGGSDEIRVEPSKNPTYPFTIPAGESEELTITFNPTGNGLEFTTIQINTNDNHLPFVSGFRRKEIHTTGGTTRPKYQLQETSTVTFRNTGLGRRNTTSINIKNVGSANLMLVKNDKNTGFFNIVDNGFTYSTAILPGETFSIPIEFLPTSNLGLKAGEIKITTNETVNGTETNEHIVNVQGEAIIAQDVEVGGLIFEAETKTNDGDYIILSGDVRAGDLEFSGDVHINPITRNIKGNGKIFLTNIPVIGIFGGDEVQIYDGNFDFTADATSASLALSSGIIKLSSALNLVGLPFEITKIEVIDNGIILGGALNLPEIFGVDAGIVIETLEIHKTNGVNLVGEASFNSDLKIANTFNLTNAFVEFNTLENTFAGGGTITLGLLGKDVSVGASVSIIKGNLDAIELIVGVDPGIPLGATGLSLTQGGGFIKGLQEGPVSFGLNNIEIVPAALSFDTVSFTDMNVSYTLGEKLSAGGAIELYNLSVGSGNLEVFSSGANISIDVNLLNILIGDANLSIEKRKQVLTGLDQIFLEGRASLKVQIPKIDCSGPICESVNEFLPLEFASISAYFNNSRVCVTLIIADDILEVTAGVEKTDSGAKFKFGGNFLGINFGDAGKIPFQFKREYNSKTDDENSLEGKSIIIDGNSVLAKSKNTDMAVPFTLNETYRNIILRVEGTNETPEFSVILPDGTEINQDNAIENRVLHTNYKEKNRRYYILANTQIGEYQFKVDNKGDNYQFDVFGAQFAPDISITNVNHNSINNDITIDWTDADLDSDASISFYFDTDNKDANGSLALERISEDDATNSIIWNANHLENGTYYIYAMISDDENAPKIVYSTQTFTIDKASVIPTTVLSSAINENTIELSWTDIPEAFEYRVFIDENDITKNSTSYNVGNDTSYDFTNIVPGRTYNFGVKVIDKNKNASNLSNIETITFISSTINNIPKIDTNTITEVINGCETLQYQIEVSDPDIIDNLQASLTQAPTGMSIDNSNLLTWTPTSNQLGSHKIIIKVDDNNGGETAKEFTVTVTDTEKPIAKAKNIEVQLDTNGKATITPDMIDDGSSDNCGIATYILSRSEFNLDNLGENKVTLQVVDFNGNISNANAIVTIDNTLGVTRNFVDNEVFVHPNPTSRFVNISSKKNEIKAIKVYTILGKEILKKTIVDISKDYKLDINSLSSGFYFIKVMTNKGFKTFKVLKK